MRDRSSKAIRNSFQPSGVVSLKRCICERFHQTIQNEFYASPFRRKLYTSSNNSSSFTKMRQSHPDGALTLGERGNDRPPAARKRRIKVPSEHCSPEVGTNSAPWHFWLIKSSIMRAGEPHSK